MRSEHKFRLGSRLRDTLTGFEGTAIGLSLWINGCVRYGLQCSTLKDGKPIEEEWFDEQRLEEVKSEKHVKPATPGSAGGPMRDPSLPKPR